MCSVAVDFAFFFSFYDHHIYNGVFDMLPLFMACFFFILLNNIKNTFV